jgi:integrase
MIDGNKVITLIDQFQAILKELGIEKNRYGEPYTLYSLRHFYAARMLHKSVPVWDIARNMGTSVQNIEQYYGKSATSQTMATKLGG